MRSGRSRCCAKIGPGSRSHKKRSVLRAEAERTGSTPRQLPRHQPLPTWRDPGVRKDPSPRGDEGEVDLPPKTVARPVVEPIVTVRRVGGRDVEVHDFSGTATAALAPAADLSRVSHRQLCAK
jgi:hypothetical protein